MQFLGSSKKKPAVVFVSMSTVMVIALHDLFSMFLHSALKTGRWSNEDEEWLLKNKDKRMDRMWRYFLGRER